MAVTFIAENQTASPVELADIGRTVPASGSTLLTDDLLLSEIWNSVDLQNAIQNDEILLNDGTATLSKSQSLGCMSSEMSAPVDLATYNVYAPSSQTFTGTVTVATATERNARGGFSVDGAGVVTVSVGGRYLVRCYCSVLGGSNGRQEASSFLELNNVEVPGTRGELYRRNSASGATAAAEAELVLVPSDTVRLRAEVTVGGGSVALRANGSSIVLERIGE